MANRVTNFKFSRFEKLYIIITSVITCILVFLYIILKKTTNTPDFLSFIFYDVGNIIIITSGILSVLVIILPFLLNSLKTSKEIGIIDITGNIIAIDSRKIISLIIIVTFLIPPNSVVYAGYKYIEDINNSVVSSDNDLNSQDDDIPNDTFEFIYSVEDPLMSDYSLKDLSQNSLLCKQVLLQEIQQKVIYSDKIDFETFYDYILKADISEKNENYLDAANYRIMADKFYHNTKNIQLIGIRYKDIADIEHRNHNYLDAKNYYLNAITYELKTINYVASKSLYYDNCTKDDISVLEQSFDIIDKSFSELKVIAEISKDDELKYRVEFIIAFYEYLHNNICF